MMLPLRSSSSCLAILVVLVFSTAFKFCEAVSLDELGSGSEQVEASMRRAFPLKDVAVSWESIDWTKYSKIIVSGPQRSGTAFFAQALAAHLGYRRLDEGTEANLTRRDGSPSWVQVVGHRTPLKEILESDERVVMQRPTWSYILHNLTAAPHPEEVFVAFLARDCLDVFRSQNRIMHGETEDTGWTCKYGRAAEWRPYHERQELRNAIEDEHDMICTIKQQAYLNYQRHHMQGTATAAVSYASFASLGAFVDSSKRTRLGPKQIAVDHT
jgi:hypothetical protein